MLGIQKNINGLSTSLRSIEKRNTAVKNNRAKIDAYLLKILNIKIAVRNSS